MNRLSIGLLIIFIPLTAVLGYVAFFNSQDTTFTIPADRMDPCDVVCRAEAVSYVAYTFYSHEPKIRELAVAPNERVIEILEEVDLIVTERESYRRSDFEFYIPSEVIEDLESLGNLETATDFAEASFYENLDLAMSFMDRRTDQELSDWVITWDEILSEQSIIHIAPFMDLFNVYSDTFRERIRLTEEKLEAQ